MKYMNNLKSYLPLLLLLTVLQGAAQSKGNKFTVVLDAGHGGKDPGNSYHGYIEKDIALKTTLKVGEFLEREKDFDVTYTRKTDVFIELVNRPKVANKLNADLFVSIHCNSVKNFEPEGTETFVMGLTRSNMNLEVAKSENSVIMLEDNYQKTYKGFDPKKPETLLGITIKKEDNLNNSITLASNIQENFTNNLNRKTRGVKQQPLWVLDASTMPGVLIELGFLSNEEEGEFLNSEEGQTKMARQIALAIIKYKKDYFEESYSADEVKYVEKVEKPEKKVVKEVKEVKETAPTKEVATAKETIDTANVAKANETGKEHKTEGAYKVQLFASSKKKEVTSPDFKGLKDITYTFENNLYRYFYGNANEVEEAKKLYQEAKKHGFTDAFIVMAADGKITALKS